MNKDKIKKLLEENTTIGEVTDTSASLIELGLSSLSMMKFVYVLRKEGVKVSFADLISDPRIDAWAVLTGDAEAEEASSVPAKAPAERQKVFDMTDLQYAYWIGSDPREPLGGVSCHAYVELDGSGIDCERLRNAYKALFGYHPMLRTRVTADGRFEEMEQPYSTVIEIRDLTGASERELEEQLLTIRSQTAQRRMDSARGESMRLSVSLLPEGKTRLHFELDLIFADVLSFSIILDDLTKLYTGSGKPTASPEWSFGSYQAERKERKRIEIETAKAYWNDRLDTLPSRPELPMRQAVEQIGRATYRRLAYNVPENVWDGLNAAARANNTTIAMALLAAYSAVIERYSENSRFLINIPVFDRDIDEGVEDVVSDFTNLMLLETEVREKDTFKDIVQTVEKRFRTDIQYASYSGVQVQRDLAKKRDNARFMAPLVFSYMIGTELMSHECTESFGQLHYMITQTPQVWIDFQIVECDGKILMSWDVADEVFPEGLADSMFDALVELTEKIAGDNDWGFIPDAVCKHERILFADNMKECTAKERCCLTDGIASHAADTPDKVALIDTVTGEEVTYGELWTEVGKIAALLENNGVQRGDHVGFTLPRGISQVVTAVAIAAYGACYVPVAEGLPFQRREHVRTQMKVDYLITNEELLRDMEVSDQQKIMLLSDAAELVSSELPKDIDPDASAYIILTSGTTGEPKGVEVSHASAWNTIRDVNARISANSEDSVLALASIDFDLSVYNIFGVLGVGGKLLLLHDDEVKDAFFWCDVIEKYRPTLWNTVPAFLNMLLIAAESQKKQLPLRAVMLSGDWIGLDLPQRLAACTENCRFISMGGATEGAIWSNWYEVCGPIPEEWASIPYGRALDAQTYRVVDSFGRDCPHWCAGELWIGGAGVAKGYCGDAALTEQKFPVIDGRRWYRTGDFGRFMGDDNIEFLGRRDSQVKIRGFRVELSEIETTMTRIDGISAAAAIVSEQGSLLAFYSGKAPVSEQLIYDSLHKALPEYMIPVNISYLEALPVTGNGKINRRALLELCDKEQEDTSVQEEYLSDDERAFLEKVRELIGDTQVFMEDGFIASGGDSISAMKLAAWLNDIYTVELSIYDILNAPSLSDLYNSITERKYTMQILEENLFRDENGRTRYPVGNVSNVMLNGITSYDNTTIDGFFIIMSFCLRIQGKLQLDRLEQGIQKIYNEEMSMRMVFEKDDSVPEGYCCKFLNYYPYKLEIRRPHGETADERYENTKTELNNIILTKPDVEHDIAGHFYVYELDEKDHVVALLINHAASDGQSLSILSGKVMEACFGIEQKMPKGAPLNEYLSQLDEHRHSNKDGIDKDYWKKAMSGYQPMPRKPKSSFDKPFTRNDIYIRIPSAKLHAFCRKRNVTVVSCLMWAAHYAVAEMYHTRDTAISFTSAARSELKYMTTTGPLIQIMPNRIHFHKWQTVAQSVAHVMKRMEENVSHEKTSFTNTGSGNFVLSYMDYRMLPISGENFGTEMELKFLPGYRLTWWTPTFEVNNIEDTFAFILAIETKTDLVLSLVCNPDTANDQELWTLREKIIEGVELILDSPDVSCEKIISAFGE